MRRKTYKLMLTQSMTAIDNKFRKHHQFTENIFNKRLYNYLIHFLPTV